MMREVAIAVRGHVTVVMCVRRWKMARWWIGHIEWARYRKHRWLQWDRSAFYVGCLRSDLRSRIDDTWPWAVPDVPHIYSMIHSCWLSVHVE